MFDNADPLYGWLMEEVEATFSGLATADIYGKLFYHLRNTLRSFCSRLSKITTSFHLLAVDALSLPQHLERDKRFSRIEVRMIPVELDCYHLLTLLASRSPTFQTVATWDLIIPSLLSCLCSRTRL